MMAPCCTLVLFELLLTASASQQWPVVHPSAQEALPNVELSLAPPPHVWPQVAAALGNLEESRERVENANMDELQAEFNEAMVDARRQIGNTIGKIMRTFDDPKLARAIFTERNVPPTSMMFRQIPQDTLDSSVLSVKVNVLPASPPDPSLRRVIEDMEYQRSDKEKDMFKSKAFGELRMLKVFILNELEVQMQAHVDTIVGTMQIKPARTVPSFLQGQVEQLPAQGNMRVVPPDVNYPSVTSMVQEMESRRDVTENLERKHILEKELDLAMACNNAAEEGLQAAVSRILAQYGPMVKSIQLAQ